MADLSNEFFKCKCNLSLMYCWGISHTHGHYHPFQEAKRGQDCSVLNVVRVYKSLEERIGHVDLLPDSSSGTVS